MSGEDVQIYATIHDLVTCILEGSASAAQQDQLALLLRESSEARRLYNAYVRETAELRWQLETSGVGDGELAARKSTVVGLDPLARLLRAWRGAAAIVLIGSVATLAGIMSQGFVGRPARVIPVGGVVGRGGAQAPLSAPACVGVATLARTSDVTWSPGSKGRDELSRLCPGDTLRFERGEVELIFDTGVEVVVRGPADFEVKGADRAFSRLGAIAARVGESGKGFTVETPTAEVVDVGTEFGIEVQPTGSTAVAVFRGRVDLAAADAAGNLDTFRPLYQGEAVRVGVDGALKPMVAISSDWCPTPLRSRRPDSRVDHVIAGLSDNRSDERNAKFYRIVRDGLYEDSLAYVDRNHEWNGVDGSGIPACVQGIEYIMPFNDDKFVQPLEISVELLRPATLYVFFSDTLEVPDWLRNDFVDTGLDIGLDESSNRFARRRKTATGPGESVDTVFSIWKRDVREASTVTLGPIRRPPDQEQLKMGFNMYGIAAAPLDTIP